MSDVICDTSPIQYLHQIGLLHVLRSLSSTVIVPPSVVSEIETGKNQGVDLPDIRRVDWIVIREPVSISALPLIKDLGPGETQVLALGLEMKNSIVVIDDNLARKIAQLLNIRLRGTLGLLLDAKRSGLVSSVAPFLDRLQELQFRVSPETRRAVLNLANE